MQEVEFIGKRVNLDVKNIKRMNIIMTLLEEQTKSLNNKQKIDFVINRAIESFYNSEEIRKELEL